MTDTTSTDLDIFKRQYVDKIHDQFPTFAVLQKEIEFDKKNRVGDRYEIDVSTRKPTGYTYKGPTSKRSGYTLNDSTPAKAAKAYSTGHKLDLRVDFAEDLVVSAQDTKQAFTPGFDLLLEETNTSVRFALEESLIYGGTDIGAISTKTNTSAVNSTLKLTVGSWCPSLWMFREGSYVDIFNAALVTKRTAAGPALVTSIDEENQSILVTFAANADQTATLATDLIVPYGANGEWFDGLNALITKSAAGASTVLGIDTATTSVWRSKTLDASSGPLTMALVSAAATKCVVGGGTGPLTLYVSPFTWTDLMNNEAALRRYAKEDGKEFVNGSDKIGFYGVNGSIEIVSYLMCKAGDAFLVAPEFLRRVGASEPNMIPFTEASTGNNNQEWVYRYPDKAAYQIRMSWDQALLATRLNKFCKIENIVNDSLPAA